MNKEDPHLSIIIFYSTENKTNMIYYLKRVAIASTPFYMRHSQVAQRISHNINHLQFSPLL